AISGAALAAVLAQNAVWASLPAAVGAATIKTATLVAASRGAAPGVVSTKVAALTEGVMKAMLLTKLKTATALLLTLTMAALASAMLTWGQTGDKSASVDKPAAKTEKPAAK